MVTTGTAAGRGWGAGGCGGGLGRGGIPGGRPAVRQGDPRPRMVGRGKGMMGTPGARGGWAGAGVALGIGPEDPTAALGAIGAFSDYTNMSNAGGTLMVFGLP